MNKHFILGQQGTSIHFIACLIRLFYDNNYYNNRPVTNETGVYDDIFGAHTLFEVYVDYNVSKKSDDPVSEIDILHELKKVYLGERKIDRDYYVEQDILTAHFSEQNTIDTILNLFEDSKITFIKFQESDLTQIGLNFLNKVYMSSFIGNRPDVTGLLRLLELYRKFPDAIIFDKHRFLNMTRKELSVLLTQIIEESKPREKFMLSPQINNNINVINFSEMSNIDALLENLSKFTQQPITDSIRSFANNFLHNQPTAESTINLIKQIQNNPDIDFIYNDIISKFNQLVFDAAKFDTLLKHKYMTNSKTFCIMPFIHQNIKHEGKVGACWRYPDRIGDYRSQTLPEIWNSEETRELRRAVLNDERPNGCRSCWDFEDSGVASTRQTCNETYKNSYNIDFKEVIRKVNPDDYSMPYEPQSIEIRFDNTCNLRCRHCSPTYSSQWEVLAFKDDEVKKFFTKWGAGRLEKKHISLPERSFEEFKNAIPYLKEVLIAGGEPLQQKRHWEMIDAMSEHAKNITLSYNSNLVALGLGYYNVLDHWPKFKKIILRVSIDGDDSTFSYFRTNGDIQKVLQNIYKLHSLNNLEMSLTTTVSIYNISRLVDIVKFVNNAGGLFHTSMVQYPRAINPKVLPKEIKEKITKEWNDFKLTLDDPELWPRSLMHNYWQDEKLVKQQKKRIVRYGDYAINYMNAEDYSADLAETAEYINFMDKQNGTSFAEVYPELASIL